MTAVGNDCVIVRFSTESLPPADRIPFWREVFGRTIIRLDIEPLPDRPFYSHGAAELGAMTHHEDSRRIGVRLPRAALKGLVPNVEDALVRPIPRDNDALRLLTGYVKVCQERQTPSSPKLRQLVVAHVYDLVALAIGASREAAAIAEERGLRAARLNAIKADIAGNLADEDLSVADVAARQRVSPRYVQLLFESEGTTFSQYLLGQRLNRAQRLLTDPCYAHLTVSGIALDAGFGDLSYFNRAFRRLYGASPSEMRAAVLGDGERSKLRTVPASRLQRIRKPGKP